MAYRFIDSDKHLIELCDQSLAARETEDVILSDEEISLVFSETARRKNQTHNKGYFFTVLGIENKTTYVFRRGLNQLLDEKGVTPTNRAKLLGHTVQTNITCYTYASRDAVEIGRNALETLSM